jgi:hypothetical protein
VLAHVNSLHTLQQLSFLLQQLTATSGGGWLHTSTHSSVDGAAAFVEIARWCTPVVIQLHGPGCRFEQQHAGSALIA